jgi:hypothetical protein
MAYTFRPPTVSRRVDATDFLWSRVSYQEGQTVLKMTDGSYRTVAVVDPDLAGVAVTYLGGHVHTIDDTEAAALTAAGYGEYLELVA